jgi:hypothetical protein
MVHAESASCEMNSMPTDRWRAIAVDIPSDVIWSSADGALGQTIFYW